VSDIPPGPWRWVRVNPGLLAQPEPPSALSPEIDELVRDGGVEEQGWGLVAADGSPVLICESGWGSPELAGGIPGPVADLLARTPELAELPAGGGAVMTRDQLRSWLLGCVVAGRVVADPDGTRALAQANLARLHQAHPRAAVWPDQWQRLLDGPLADLLTTLTSPSPAARDLRQNTPFAGVLTDEERERVLQTARGLRPPVAGELVDRFRRLPPVDADRLRADVDAAVDQRLPEAGRTATRGEVWAVRAELRRLAETQGLRDLRVDQLGVILVTMPADDSGYGALKRFASAASAAVGCG
jgi:hypothetical protein